VLKSALATVGMVKPNPSRGQKEKCREMRRDEKQNRRGAIRERKVMREAKRGTRNTETSRKKRR